LRLTSPRVSRATSWIAAGVIACGIAALTFALIFPRAARSNFEFGLLYTVTRYDQALPLVGIGFAIAQLPLRLCIIGLIVFALGVPAGGLMSDGIAATLSQNPGLAGYVFLIAPICSVAVGATLATPRLIAAMLTPVAAFFSGAVLGLVVSFNDPSAAAIWFAAGAVLSGLWLTVPPLLLWRQFQRPWFPIAGRIFGAWLIAIGAMLIASQLIPLPLPAEPPPEVSAPGERDAPYEIAPQAPNAPGLSDDVQ
jgi:hypothetical protein